MSRRIRVLFPVTDLSSDGAQRQLFELVKGLDKRRFSPVVLALQRGGTLEAEFRRVPGARLFTLERKGRYDFLYLFKMFNLVRRLRPDVIQPFLTPATFFGLLDTDADYIAFTAENRALADKMYPPGKWSHSNKESYDGEEQQLSHLWR